MMIGMDEDGYLSRCICEAYPWHKEGGPSCPLGELDITSNQNTYITVVMLFDSTRTQIDLVPRHELSL